MEIINLPIYLALSDKNILFDDWRKLSPYSLYWVREAINENSELEEYILLCLNKTTNIWVPTFVGDRIHNLTESYRKMFPKPCSGEQLQEAKNQVDLFIKKFNSLAAFL
jgi:hypothetical protein